MEKGKKKQNHYELLGVDVEATPTELAKAYRRSALRLHPDKNMDDPERAAELFDEIRKAYDILSTPSTRTAYDLSIRQLLEKRRRDEEMHGERRRMRDELEARERAALLARQRSSRSDASLLSARLDSIRASNLAHRQALEAELDSSLTSNTMDKAYSSTSTTTTSGQQVEIKWKSKLSIDRRDLEALLQRHGRIHSLVVQPSRNCALVSFESSSAAVDLVAKSRTDPALAPFVIQWSSPADSTPSLASGASQLSHDELEAQVMAKMMERRKKRARLLQELQQSSVDNP